MFEELLELHVEPADKLSKTGFKELLATACGYIWWQRRQLVHVESINNPSRMSKVILAITLNYVRSTKKNVSIRRHGWKTLKEGFCKMNADASIQDDSCSGAVGSVIRDDNGMFVACSNSGIPSISDASSAEARALCDGLVLVGQVGCTKHIINSELYGGYYV
jgi:hypothetical protein